MKNRADPVTTHFEVALLQLRLTAKVKRDHNGGKIREGDDFRPRPEA